MGKAEELFLPYSRLAMVATKYRMRSPVEDGFWYNTLFFRCMMLDTTLCFISLTLYWHNFCIFFVSREN
jgi:hypothetical protein